MKPTHIWQLNCDGETKFARIDWNTGASEGLASPADKVHLIANWRITYKTIWQTIRFKFHRAVKKLKYDIWFDK